MKTHCTIIATVLAAAFSATAKTFDWPISAPTAGAAQFTAYHGETVRFNLRLSGVMTNLSPVCIYYQTNGMGKAEWFGPVPGTVFHPTNDCGAAFYRFFIRCDDPDGINYTPNGSLRMLDSPGFTPGELPLPAKVIDFARVAVTNAPWTAEIAAMRTELDEVSAAVGAGRSWNRPGDWTLTYLPVMESTDETFVDITTNDIGMVSSNVTRRVAQGLSARMYAESLDQYSQAEPPAIVALEVSDGGTASNDVVTVPATGLYTVKGYAANGTAKQINVSFSGTERSESASVYFDDSVAARKTANDFAAACIGGAHPVRSGTDVDGNAYTIYGTARPMFGAKNGWGKSVPYAIAPRFAATGAHYWSYEPWLNYNVTYPATSAGATSPTYTIKSSAYSFNLATWALTNGFLEAEVAAAGISDVLIIPLQDGWQFPQGECPYFATEEWMTNNYLSLRGMTIWAVTQTSEYGIPMTVTSADGNIYWRTAAEVSLSMSVPRLDIAHLIGMFNERNWWRVKVGDSGKPLWLSHAQEEHGTTFWHDILLSHFHWVGGGPNYVKAARIVKALCQQWNTPIRILE